MSDLVLGAFHDAPPLAAIYKVLNFVPRTVRDTLWSRSDGLLADSLVNAYSMHRRTWRRY